MNRDYAGKTVWIIGASSGIGRALAEELSHRGAMLVLSARSADMLQRLNESLGRHHMVAPLDVSDAGSFEKAFNTIRAREIDSVVYLAATYAPGTLSDMKPEDLHASLAINLEGAFTLVRHILPYFRARGKGQIALCASVAGYRGLPNAQPYGATKAALINLAESLRCEYAGKNIDIKVINPGFVRTRLTDKNTFSMPMIVEPERAGREIADGLLARSFEIHFPKGFTRIMKLIRFLPDSLYFRLARNLTR